MTQFSGFHSIKYNVFLGVPSTNSLIEISDIVTKIEIFSSMYQLENHGTIVINDTRGKLGDYTFLGDEILTISFEDSNDNKIIKSFHLYNLCDYKANTTNKLFSFTGHFASEALYNCNAITLSKGFSNTSISNVFKQISNYLKINKNMVIEDTKGNYSNYTINNIKGKEVIYNLTKSAISPTYNSPYVCFEDNNDTIYFCSMEYLINRNLSVSKLRYTNYAFKTPDYDENGMVTYNNESYYNVTNFEEINNTNSIQQAHNGGINMSQNTIDLLKRSVRSFKNDISEIKDSIYSSGLLNNSPNVISMGYVNTIDHPNYLEKRPLMQLFQTNLNLTQIAFTTYGDLTLNPGDIFTFFAPKHGANESNVKPDERLSGKYIISNLRHDILNGKIFTTLESNRVSNDTTIT